MGGTGSTILNAANEIAVGAFLDRRIRFTDISRVIQATLEQIPVQEASSVQAVLDGDAQARRFARLQACQVQLEA
jgi:1-deoxy-D-xylulose-5-phosphate reductoisomerase